MGNLGILPSVILFSFPRFGACHLLLAPFLVGRSPRSKPQGNDEKSLIVMTGKAAVGLASYCAFRRIKALITSSTHYCFSLGVRGVFVALLPSFRASSGPPRSETMSPSVFRTAGSM